MVLADKDIRKLCEENNLISPFSEDNLQSESYDVSIGNEITIFSKNVRCIDIRNSDNVRGLYDTKKTNQ